MADVNKSGSNLVRVENTEIPPGYEHQRCREALFNAGAGVNIPDQHGWTPLIFVVKQNHVQCIDKLIKAGADVNIPGQYGWTPLMLAVIENHVQCLNALIKAGAVVNIKSKQGNTALNLAAHWGREACLKLLIEAGADVNIPNDHRTTPLCSSIDGQFDVFFVNKLIDGQYKFCEVGASAIGGRWENIPDILVKAGANVNQRDRDGSTPLMAAVAYNLMRITNMLLTAGADVNIRDRRGRDALGQAAGRNYYKAIELLCKAGADVNNCNEALLTAARAGHTDCVKSIVNFRS